MKPVRFSAVAIAVALAMFVTACGGDTSATATTTSQPAPTGAAGGGEATEDFSALGALPEEKVQPADVEWGDLDLTDQRLFTVRAEIDETFRTQAAEIWSDDYRLDQTPLAFAYRDSTGEITKVYAFHHPDGAFLPGATKVQLDEKLGLGDVYRIDPPENIADLPDSMPFDFGVDVGGTSSMLLFLTEDDPFLSPATWDFARFVVHETFHRYQLIDAGWNEDFPDSTPYPRDAENAALALLEDRVLAATVDADDTDEIRRRLRQFLAIRQARAEAFEFGNLEPVQEVVEGTARYVENRYAEVNGRPGRWVTEVPEVALDWLEFGRFYDTGAQLGRALDRLGVDWKNHAAEGTALVEIVLDTVEASDSGALLEDAKVEFDYAAILAKAIAADLENAQGFDPMGGVDVTEIVTCLADNGVPIDPTADPDEVLSTLPQVVDMADPVVTAALETCGIGSVPTGAPPGGPPPGGVALDPEELIACLTEAGIEVGPDGLAGIDPNDPAIQEAFAACAMGRGS
ncbi:MAG: hypothetical protein U9O63_04280 [Actinomycetota bacterium]|nr:hypothetical protein [Actinomycetota bacterium]